MLIFLVGALLGGALCVGTFAGRSQPASAPNSSTCSFSSTTSRPG